MYGTATYKSPTPLSWRDSTVNASRTIATEVLRLPRNGCYSPPGTAAP